MTITHTTARRTKTQTTKIETPSFATMQYYIIASRLMRGHPLRSDKTPPVKNSKAAKNERQALQIVDHLRAAKTKLATGDKTACSCPGGQHTDPRATLAKTCRIVSYGSIACIGGVEIGYDVLSEAAAFATWYELGHRGPAMPYNDARRTVRRAEGKSVNALFGMDVAEDLRWRAYVDKVGSEVVQRAIWCRLTMKG
ncbi:hypothetical protein LTR35_000499 [Friedmanniomyces endolithicus]|uniref:Uncharacterized protein n=1 Tax=Friedmanniomyces endolithicus TaxID=329885 RepID=A0AAN6FX03_9PEZI|nr:hypothetical protein LTS00_009341 [Friedmanniomyces endolithicus]KAK0293891.1 hypothetical protein LTR35_000499 [Friedmanniomyces endolithicus]KAK0324406.1 hypothetical protein LTR82_004846 [Friedmanniomyces endolithicus]KAK0991754.1 hypothetical protein LTR54_011675 [Friedmanniomyces endolithicus]